MNNLMKAFAGILLLVSALMVVAPSYAASSPVTELNSIADQLIAKLKANKATLKESPGLVYSLANSIVLPHADIDEMSKRVLPPNVWNKASSAQRSQFKKAFSTLLVHTYASALADYNDQVIHFYPVRGGYEGKSSVQVNSSIERSDGPAIAVNYKLLSAGSTWKLYDLSVEGVSMLESFRSQFADQLAQGDIQTLINKLNSHNSGTE